MLDDSWAELLQVLFQLSQAPDAGKRETAFRVFTTTPGIIEKQHEDAVAQAFAQAFKDDSVQVRWISLHGGIYVYDCVRNSMLTPRRSALLPWKLLPLSFAA